MPLPWWRGGFPTFDISPMLRQPTIRAKDKFILGADVATSTLLIPRPTSADRCFIYSITLRATSQNQFGAYHPYLQHEDDATIISFGQARPCGILQGYTWRPQFPQFWSKEAKNLRVFVHNQGATTYFLTVEWAEN